MMKRYLVVLGSLMALLRYNAAAVKIDIAVTEMRIKRGTGQTYPEVRQIASAAGGRALVWGATTDQNRTASAEIEIGAQQAPAASYTLWIRQSYSDRGAVLDVTGIKIEVNGKTFGPVQGPQGDLYYTTSLETFYWTPVSIGNFNGGSIKLTRDASGGGHVATDLMVLSDDERWQPEGYVRARRFPKTIAAFAGPLIELRKIGAHSVKDGN
ncbi:MAG: hypothetical protein JXR37_15255 [Kiritimatiellae bacterium]|nr:hypothetical protein [Kiritimatiellia bacterium]